MGNKLWVVYCGCKHISCGVGIVEDFVYVVGAVYTHNIYVCTHNVHPQYIQLYVLWVYFVGTHICIVGNTLWVNCCGGSCIYCGGQGIYCGERIVGSVLWVQTCILWSRYCGGSCICGGCVLHPQYMCMYPEYTPTIHVTACVHNTYM